MHARALPTALRLRSAIAGGTTVERTTDRQ